MARSFIEWRLKRAKFFDRNVARGLKGGHRRALSKFGAFVRSDARRSMKTARPRKTAKNTIEIYRPVFKRDRQRGSVEEGGRRIRVTRTGSTPPNPPRAVQGHIKRFLFFEYEDRRGPNVVIGPWKLPHKTVTRHPVPAMHEQKRPDHAHVRRRINGKVVTQKYPQRPYMKPAFNKNVRKVSGLYRDVVKRR